MSCEITKAEIVKGSKNEFSIELVDDCGRPVSLSDYVSGTLTFTNCDGVDTVINLTVPGLNPDRGLIAVTILSAETVDADENWTNALLSLVDGASEPKLIKLENQFEIVIP